MKNKLIVIALIIAFLAIIATIAIPAILSENPIALPIKIAYLSVALIMWLLYSRVERFFTDDSWVTVLVKILIAFIILLTQLWAVKLIGTHLNIEIF